MLLSPLHGRHGICVCICNRQDVMGMLAVRELTVSSASSLTVRARWSCRALTVTWAYTAPPAGTHTTRSLLEHTTHLHGNIHMNMSGSACDSCTPPTPQPPTSNLSHSLICFLVPPPFISLGLSLMARVNWLLSNCRSLAWVTKTCET